MNALNNTPLSNPELLQKIDKLRDRTSDNMWLFYRVKLVVVGDQSSGKSSLLESLTGIAFPRDVELCTRHATQITMRRDRQVRTSIYIIPGPQASEDHKMYLRAYTPKIPPGKDLRSAFPSILRELTDYMGVRTDMSSKTGSVFSEDTLKIEICGPHEDYLTVIDVPGIFRKHTEGITTKDDINLVRNLVRSYVRDKRTIILAVLPANVDISTQEILAFAEEYDRLGKRILGILTKPDLVTEPSAQTLVCNLLLGKRMPFSLGYYLVRNRGADDAATGEDTLDKFFQQQP